MIPGNGVVPAVSKSAGVLLPGGKLSLWISLFFLCVLMLVGVSESISQSSLFPFFDNVLIKTVGADAGLYSLVTFDSVAPSYQSFFSKDFFDFVWFEVVFWLKVASYVWFLFVVAWLLFKGSQGLNSTSSFIAVLLTIIFFVGLQFLVSVAVFDLNLSNYYPHQSTADGVLVLLPSDNIAFFNSMIVHTYPFHGVVALYNRFFSPSWFYSVKSFGESDFGSLIFNSINTSEVIR